MTPSTKIVLARNRASNMWWMWCTKKGKGLMAERSKAFDLRSNLERGAGSNPAQTTFGFYGVFSFLAWREAAASTSQKEHTPEEKRARTL